MLALCAGCAADNADFATVAPASTMIAWPEQTGVSVEECPPNAQCAPPPNSYEIPEVVGMRVEAACRAMLRKEFVPYVYGKRQSSEFGPGRVVLQNPEAGSIPGGPTGVFLFVSKPFPDLLPRDTHCAE